MFIFCWRIVRSLVYRMTCGTPLRVTVALPAVTMWFAVQLADVLIVVNIEVVAVTQNHQLQGKNGLIAVTMWFSSEEWMLSFVQNRKVLQVHVQHEIVIINTKSVILMQDSSFFTTNPSFWIQNSSFLMVITSRYRTKSSAWGKYSFE